MRSSTYCPGELVAVAQQNQTPRAANSLQCDDTSANHTLSWQTLRVSPIRRGNPLAAQLSITPQPLLSTMTLLRTTEQTRPMVTSNMMEAKVK
jgi:predicted  nucleic acid-binding Zn ribbon protein